MSERRKSNIKKGMKDYMVPIVGLLLIVILIFSVFSNDNKPVQIDLENKIGLELTLNGSNTESYIVYPGEFKKQIEGDISLYKGEKLIVKEGNVNLSLLGLGDFRLNKLGELEYLENGDFSLESSDLWLNSTSGLNVDMKFASVRVGDNTHISFSQNEMGSSIYLISGFAEVVNLAGESSVLASGQKITISRLDANNDDIDLSLEKENIDDYFKQSDWFIINNGASYVDSGEEEDEETSTGTTSSSYINSNSSIINLTNLLDESNVSSDIITISGNFNDEEIIRITLNGENALINKDLKTFKFDNISVANKENDLVFKVYDDANDLLAKFIYTVYYAGGNNVTSNSSSAFNVQTFDVDGSKFTFTNIKDGTVKDLNGKTTYVTYGDFLTIYGDVKAEGIDTVSVNGYTLKSFNGSSWRYHPSTVNNNLSTGTNVYEINYYDNTGNVIYKNNFTIIKKESNIISDEASIN